MRIEHTATVHARTVSELRSALDRLSTVGAPADAVLKKVNIDGRRPGMTPVLHFEWTTISPEPAAIKSDTPTKSPLLTNSPTSEKR